MAIDVGVLYDILRAVAAAGRTLHYSDLSAEYHRRTGEWHEPHGTWDGPLGEINVLTHQHTPSLPPLSAVVTLKPDHPGEQPEPGGLFWGSSPGVPSKPRSKDERFIRWAAILKQVHDAEWPDRLTGSDSELERQLGVAEDVMRRRQTLLKKLAE